jgi:hypothetical protein
VTDELNEIIQYVAFEEQYGHPGCMQWRKGAKKGAKKSGKRELQSGVSQ